MPLAAAVAAGGFMRLREALALLVFATTGCGPTYVVNTPPTAPAVAARAIPVYPNKSIGRPCEIIAVFDFHSDADSQDKGFDQLRARAYEIGADAVIGAEFEHGEGTEPSHLSGMAVRYTTATPPYEVIGVIDIESSPDSSDKGLDAMTERARQLGADKVVDVTFEHGEEGSVGHLRGKAIRIRR
jgi:uncharacterized protein YbjQ (UPF0145 family)